MPNITLTIDAVQAARVRDALADTDYPTNLVGYKQFLIDHTKNLVQDFERAQAQRAALATVTDPADVQIT